MKGRTIDKNIGINSENTINGDNDFVVVDVSSALFYCSFAPRSCWCL